MADLFLYPNVTGINGLLLYTNSVTDGFMGMFLIIIAFFGVTITALQFTTEFDKAIVVGAWASAILSTLFFGIGIISEMVLVACVIGAAGSTFFNLSKK